MSEEMKNLKDLMAKEKFQITRDAFSGDLKEACGSSCWAMGGCYDDCIFGCQEGCFWYCFIGEYMI